MKTLQSLLSSDSRSASAIRAVFLAWAFVVLAVWVGLSIYKMALQPVDTSIATILMGLAVAKAGQRFAEGGKGDEKA